MIIVILILCLLAKLGYNQSSLQWNIAEEVETSSIITLMGSSLGVTTKYANVTFKTQFTDVPTVILSLVNLQSFTANLGLYQEVERVTATYFQQKTIGKDSYNSVKTVIGNYLAINRNVFSYMYPHVGYATPSILKNMNNPPFQFIQVNYLAPLNSTRTYEVMAFLTGFSANCSADCEVGVSVQYYTNQSYILRLVSQGGFLSQMQYTRILIDKTAEASLPTGLNQIQIDMGSVTHYKISYYPSVYTPGIYPFYSPSFFYGVQQFAIKFNLLAYNSIFTPLSNREDIMIFYMAIKQKKCHETQPYYQSVGEVCYKNCEFKLYYLSSTQCAKCSEGCYQCLGPLPTDCVVCLAEFNREFDPVTNQCNCLAGMISAPDWRCMTCSDAIFGCDVCINTTHCSICQSGCASDGNNGCICQGSSVCDSTTFQYISPHTGQCLCLPQYFLNASTGLCDPCDMGCFICSGQSSNCTECVDSYYLLNNLCLFFIVSETFISKDPGLIQQNERCLAKIGDYCIEQCLNPSIIQAEKCYQLECPTSKFKILDPYGNYYCQPCKAPCIQCQKYYLCDICQNFYYYRSNTGQCLSCPKNCFRCENSITCEQCLDGFVFDSDFIECRMDINVSEIVNQCEEGCKQCVLKQFCQICENGYFLSQSTFQCVKCQDYPQALWLSQPFIDSRELLITCQEICGDGIIINQHCDDRNNVSGDGCSEDCEIQQNYSCQYLSSWEQSVCYKDGYQFMFNLTKNLTSNLLTVLVSGNGVDAGIQPLMITCEGEYQIVNITIFYQDLVHYKQFQLLMNSSMENSTCQLYIEGTQGFDNASYIILTAPQALIIDIQQNSSMQALKNIYNSIFPYFSVLIWIVLIVSIDPYQSWGLLYFNVINLMLLYDYLHSLPNTYCLLEGLQYLVIRYGEYSLDAETYLSNNYKILLFFVIILLYNELLVRFLKNQVIFPVSQVAIFRRIFEQRFSTYYCVYLSIQPIIYLNCYQIIQTYFSSQNTTLSQFTSNQIISIVVLIFHSICFILVLIFMIIEIKSILNYNPITDQNMFHYKFTLILCSCKILNILLVISIIYNDSYQMINSLGMLIALFFWLIMILMDSIPETLKPSAQLLSFNQYDQQDSDSSSILAINTKIEDNEEQNNNSCWSFSKIRLYLRKINLVLRVITILIISCCRFVYYADYNTVVDTSSEPYYHPNYLKLGDVTIVVFIFGIYTVPLVISIILQIFILIHFVETDAQIISEKLEEERLKLQKKENKKNIESENSLDKILSESGFSSKRAQVQTKRT